MKSRKKRLLEKIEKKLYLEIVRLVNRRRYQRKFFLWMKKVGINIQEYPCYISPDVFLDELDYSKISIEKEVTISRGVTLLLHDHSITRVLENYGTEKLKNSYILREIHIKEGAFIGANTTILPGTIIGENSIIGAGSVVKGEIPKNVVAAGNPCKVICSIEDYYKKISNFPDEYIVKEYK